MNPTETTFFCITTHMSASPMPCYRTAPVLPHNTSQCLNTIADCICFCCAQTRWTVHALRSIHRLVYLFILFFFFWKNVNSKITKKAGKHIWHSVQQGAPLLYNEGGWAHLSEETGRPSFIHSTLEKGDMPVLQTSWMFCPTTAVTREGLASSRMALKEKAIPLTPLLPSSLGPLIWLWISHNHRAKQDWLPIQPWADAPGNVWRALSYMAKAALDRLNATISLGRERVLQPPSSGRIRFSSAERHRSSADTFRSSSTHSWFSGWHCLDPDWNSAS